MSDENRTPQPSRTDGSTEGHQNFLEKFNAAVAVVGSSAGVGSLANDLKDESSDAQKDVLVNGNVIVNSVNIDTGGGGGWLDFLWDFIGGW